MTGESAHPDAGKAPAGAPPVTFGIIVLNGEPFTRYCLRSLYPFAHQIIVVEGSALALSGVGGNDGHSTDGTLDVVRAFQQREDPESKVTLVTAEDDGYPNGFWPGEKHEQSQAYARRATGDYLWQVDVDEFYCEEDMSLVLDVLAREPDVAGMSFKQVTFWGGLDYTTDGWYLRRGATYYHRLFRWGPGYEYVTHRPPTVRDHRGRDLRDLLWVTGRQTAAAGVFLYHYSLLFPQQVRDKVAYYRTAQHSRRLVADADRWLRDSYLSLEDPYHVHNVYSLPSWLERYDGPHPAQVLSMAEAVAAGCHDLDFRRTDDIDVLLASPAYRVRRFGLKVGYRVERMGTAVRRAAKRSVKRMVVRV